MATRIRLRRTGRKKLPIYRIVVADKEAPRDGRFIEVIGTYAPKEKDGKQVTVDTEKAKAWLAKGATASDRVHRFLADAGVLKHVTHNNPEKAKPKKKAQERAKAAAGAAPAA
jgi:small subunit ribosomal protein S16